jgi:hypothetical protein
MRQNAFYPELNEFCMKWATPIPGSVTVYGGPLQTEAPGFETQFHVHQEALFEQLLLFDSIDIPINGPNVIVPLLCNHMGAKVFEELLEQNAITFVVWQPTPLMSHKDGKVGATFVGRFGDGKDSELDIEKIVDQGLAIQPNKISLSHTRVLKRKLLGRHSILDQNLPADAWVIADKALKEGAFEHRWLSSEFEIVGAPLKQGQELLSAAESILKYRYVLSKGMTSFNDEGVYDLFEIGINNLQHAKSPVERFSTIAEFEKFPSLRSLYGELENPFRQAARFRQTSRARRFREWLSSATDSGSQMTLIREYVDACGNRKGLFDSNPGRFVKVAAVAVIATLGPMGIEALGGDHALGTVLTGLSASMVAIIREASFELGLGVIETFMIENLKVGWTPRAYIDGLRRLRRSVETRD